MVEARSKPASQDSSRIRFQNIFEQIDLNQRKTSIISTLGPSTQEPDKMSQLLEAGTNIVRLNFAFGDHKVGSFSNRDVSQTEHFINLFEIVTVALSVAAHAPQDLHTEAGEARRHGRY